ncbi:hypothetical protein ACT7DA_14580 [Bacillus pacificus]
MSHYKEEKKRVNIVIGKVDEELKELDGRVVNGEVSKLLAL